ncbi:hypothetical protein MHAS_00213 [Mycolicibacterium hassiacum DSM 44199]|nr:cutinase family protein [Mycolicibacterium hassiacum]VCT88529.1 hypothetical protein MHAS_00213 [Mycolicibacterium hassiacum DSM 44199]
MSGRMSMLGRFTTFVGAAVTAGAAFVGTTIAASATATAQPGCPAVHWIGAAGSGERANPTSYAGMGRVVHRSMTELAERVQGDGLSMTYEAVNYPAVEVPDEDDGIGAWLGFMGSVDTGTAALGQQFQRFVERCPGSKVVLAGYSQGAMVVHRNLHALADNPNLAAVLLIADGDRRPDDPTVNIGTAASVPGRGKGVAQDWPILAHAPAPLPPAIGVRTISVCDLGDAVCDYDPNAEAVTARSVAIHTAYGRSGDQLAWTEPLYALLKGAPAPALPAAEAQPVVPLSAAGE